MKTPFYILKIESGKIQISPIEMNFRNLIERMAKIFGERAQANKLNLLLDVNVSQEKIFADEVKLKQILYNLLSNAVKFTEEGGKIGIKLQNTTTEIHTTIWDTGVGIASENYSKLFVPFKRLEQAKGRQIPGTGLGLAITKKLIELHKGRIWIEPHSPQGTEFHFILPVENNCSV